MSPKTTFNATPAEYRFLGVDMRILLTGEETGGQFTMIHGTMPPGGDGGLHVHAREDESMTMLEGALEVTIGNMTFRLEAGQSYFAPRGIPHRLRNTGSTPARSLLVTTPGGFDAFVREAGTPLPLASDRPEQPPTAEQMQALMQLAARHGITVLEPPSPQSPASALPI
ncbi:cupin domain-containing protein [Sphingomonas sp.]|uniref:cupin domain-containing protein n=1 Tax=Sphingomonas sp. TaxID=28214 RepID=UPI003B3B61BD